MVVVGKTGLPVAMSRAAPPNIRRKEPSPMMRETCIMAVAMVVVGKAGVQVAVPRTAPPKI